MSSILLFVVLMLLPANIFAQSDSANLSISGIVMMRVGEKVVKSLNSVVSIKATSRGAYTHKGEFKIYKLKSGTYTMSVKTVGCETFDTVIVLRGKPLKNIVLTGTCGCSKVSRATAENDMQKKSPNLLLIPGGIVGATTSNHVSNEEKKYGFRYLGFGCTSPAEACMTVYNQRIFEYLDSLYGKSWREEVREDIVGFQK